jgi:hypothetical protein
MTLRSGAAAAVASSYQCLNHKDTTGIDPVLGDDPLDPPHDEWVRVSARPGYYVSYSTGPNQWHFYGLRKNDTLGYLWTQIEGWDWYGVNPANGNPVVITNPAQILVRTKLVAAWSSRLAFYCISGDPTATGVTTFSFLDEAGVPIAPTIDPLVIADHTTLVQLLAYYDQMTGLTTYYPMPQGTAVPFTGSCMASFGIM